jgi:diguanylate cyclase (GGDEF)-like protein/putative nucleotidyltransferase with HDIG domain
LPNRTHSTLRLVTVGRVYLAAVIVSGIMAVGACLVDVQIHPLPPQWYLLAVLTLVSGSATVNLPTVGASISVSETFVFASVLLFGPAAGTLTVALDGLVISFWMAKRRPEWYRALFNMAAPAISIWVAAQLLFALAQIRPLFEQQSPINALLLPLIVFAIVYFGLNSWLIAFAVAFESRVSAYRIWRQNFLWLSLNYFTGASVALLLVAYSNNVDLRVLGVIVPLLLGSYLTFKTAFRRVEDAHSHLQQVNRLYLTTIETLANFIDAKDQTTHGHIRRVQQYAVRLARELGVSDERLIKAIEAAALLHDMGKLAIPEYILNKPGKLTAAEFERMKLHASVGADLLAAIEFPYPVVPIVRHHHENWDGTGYPDGLKGTAIPIGARILSVVDCFDALVSDRPYRPKLTDEEALAILVERRGSMYDPWVVDTFLRLHTQIAPDSDPAEDAQLTAKIVSPVTHPSKTNLLQEPVTPYEVARVLANQVDLGTAANVIARHLGRVLPSQLCVFYIYDSAKDELSATYSIGEAASIVRGLRINLGQRLSGWVAANRQTIINSDARLDLGDAASSTYEQLRSCLSTPLIAEGSLVGVLTVYSSDAHGFSDEHKRTIEEVAQRAAETFNPRASQAALETRALTKRLPQFDHLEQFVTAASFPGVGDTCFTLLFIDVVDLDELNRIHDREVADGLLTHVIKQIHASLRGADILFSSRNDQFVAFLNDVDAESGQMVVQRLHENLRHNPFNTASARLDVRVSITSVSAPRDGDSLTDLVARARSGATKPNPDRRYSFVH